jgi:hypothetical protein
MFGIGETPVKILRVCLFLGLASTVAFAQRGGSRGGGGGGGFHGGGGGGFHSGGGGGFGGGFRGGSVGFSRGGYGRGFVGGYGRGFGYGYGRFGYGFGLGLGLGYWGGYGYPYYYGYPGYYGYSYPYDYSYAYPSYDPGPAVVEQNYYSSAAPPAVQQYPPSAPQYSPSPQQQRGETIYLIAFKDHRITAAKAYWAEGDALHYVTREGEHKQAPFDSIDRAFSEQLNRDRHVAFQLPR